MYGATLLNVNGVNFQNQSGAQASGTADIIGFGTNGVTILRNTIFINTFIATSYFSYNIGGWRVDKHVRLVADTTGNGRSDIVGFGDTGVYISINDSNNTWGPPKLVLSGFGYDIGGWRIEKHIRYMADTRKAGRADIVGFGDAGVYISYNKGGGIFTPSMLVCPDFGYVAGGWRLDKHLRFLADVTGDGTPDIVGFGETQVVVAINNGNGTFQPAKAIIRDFTCGAGGWHIDKHPRMLADLTGDGRADIIGFGDTGVNVMLNNGDGTFQPPKLAISAFGYINGGWRVDKHPRFVADLTGDGRGDIVGFADAGVFVALNNGDGTFQAPKLALEGFGCNLGWSVENHPRFVVDLTGDGAADIIGFGDSSVLVSYNDGKGNFGPLQQLTGTFAYNGGEWSLDKTVRYVTNIY